MGRQEYEHKKGDVVGFFNRHHELLEDVHRVDRVADST